jgi:hypothetical protein
MQSFVKNEDEMDGDSVERWQIMAATKPILESHLSGQND